MDIQESVDEINQLRLKLQKCEDDLDNVEKEIEELLSVHKKKFEEKEEKKEETKKRKKRKKEGKK